MHDVLVVGAGPAGTVTAGKLAAHGVDVLLLEKEKLPRYKACGGGLPYHAHKFLPELAKLPIHDTVQHIIFSYKGRFLKQLQSRELFIAMVLRDEFDQFLLQQAINRGARYLDSCPVVALQEKGDVVEVSTTRGDFKALYCVGADGASSIIAEKSGLQKTKCKGLAISAEVSIAPAALRRAKGKAFFDFGSVPGGYAWIFPKKEQVSIGVCSTFPGYKGLRKDLCAYLASQPMLQNAEVHLVKGAPLPFFQKAFPLHTRRVLLVGDAAGLVDPISGEGIHYAVESAHYAAQALMLCLSGETTLAAYSEKVEQTIISELRYARELADQIYTYPALSYLFAMIFPPFSKFFVQLVMGKLSYQQIHQKLFGNKMAKFCWDAGKKITQRLSGNPNFSHRLPFREGFL